MEGASFFAPQTFALQVGHLERISVEVLSLKYLIIFFNEVCIKYVNILPSLSVTIIGANLLWSTMKLDDLRKFTRVGNNNKICFDFLVMLIIQYCYFLKK